MKKFNTIASAVLILTSTALTSSAEVIIIEKSDGETLQMDVESIKEIRFAETPSIVVDNSVDLGLSVRWAPYNVGANSESEQGLYVAWGETEAKDSYNWSNYSFGASASKITKYGKNDMVTILSPEDDAASVIMGEEWRMPTQEEFEELIKNCKVAADKVDDVSGIRFTSKIEGYEDKSIFFPVCGEKKNEGIMNALAIINMWTSTLNNTSLMGQGRAYGMEISLVNITPELKTSERCYGRPVRGVIAKNDNTNPSE